MAQNLKNKYKNEINNIIEQLIKLYHPQKIILFGSITDDCNEDSDIDLFIIKDNIPYYGDERIRELDKLIKYNIATDFIVYSSKEVEKALKDEDPFIINILEKGKVLYNAA